MSYIGFEATDSWTVTDLQVFLHQLNILYNRLYVLNELEPGSAKGRLGNLLNASLSRVPTKKQLTIHYLEIHSPAKISLEGADKIIAQLRGLIRDLLYDNRLDQEKKNHELQSQKQHDQIDLAKGRMDLIERQIGIMERAGFSKEEIQENIRKLTEPTEKVIEVMHEKNVNLIANGDA